MEKLFNKLIEVRDISQQMHWNNSENIPVHEALEDFYNDILKHSDLLIEVYQGQNGLIEDFGIMDKVDHGDKVKYFSDFASFVRETKNNIEKDMGHLISILDEILITTYKLIYKLKYLNNAN